jgi:nucleotide-binding universal stress UspA family protein
MVMSYKSLIIHVEPTDAGRERIRVAVEIARSFDARVIGIGARALNPMPDPIGLSIVKLKQETTAELLQAELLFKEETGALGDASLWISEIDFPTEVLLKHASGADLIVAARNVEGNPAETQAGSADLIMAAGLPLLTVPAGARPDFRTIIVAWKDTREARRAITEALPFLKRAETVRVLRIGPGDDEAQGVSEITERLRWNGVPAEAETRMRVQETVASDLLAAANELSAGLIVAGGYGHSRLREWVLGGVTQGLLEQSSRCVLFSH